MKHRIYRLNQTYYHYKGLLEKHNFLVRTFLSPFPGWYEYIEVYDNQNIKNNGVYKTPFEAYKTLKNTGIINDNNNKPNKN